MRFMFAFTVPSYRWAQIAVLIFATATTISPAPAADPAADRIDVILDQARITKVPDRTTTVVVGNPLIADVSIHAGGIMVVTGKGYGVTNMIAIDRTGRVLGEQLVRVRSPADNVVVYRGAGVRESYNCAPYCEPRITLGDKSERYPEKYFDGILQQTVDRDRGAQQGTGGQGSGANTHASCMRTEAARWR
jgi:hypothetical protein